MFRLLKCYIVDLNNIVARCFLPQNIIYAIQVDHNFECRSPHKSCMNQLKEFIE